jgi:peptide/nickel transport system ATP-binding protein
MTDVVTAESVSRTYSVGGHQVRAVRSANLVIAVGEVVGICGPSGSGKSSLLRILAGIERPDSGRVLFSAVDAWSRKGARRASLPRPGFVSPVFQDPVASLDRRWPLWRTITEPLTVTQRLGTTERQAIARDQLARVGLGYVDENRLPGQLSAGQCQRVAILRALVARPGLVVADEPTAMLDVTTAAGITRLLREASRTGAAVLVVSHDLNRLGVLADRVLRMEGGRLSELSRMEILARSEDELPVVRDRRDTVSEGSLRPEKPTPAAS